MKLTPNKLRKLILQVLSEAIQSNDLLEREKKSKKISKSTPRKDYIYPHTYGIGLRPDFEEDEDDTQLDNYVFGDGADSFDAGK